jgi:hypothetical protein
MKGTPARHNQTVPRKVCFVASPTAAISKRELACF